MTFWVTAKLQSIGYPMKFLRCNNGTAIQSHRLCWTDTKGKMTTFLDKSSLWMKPGLAHMNQTWNTNQMNGRISVLLVRRKCALHNVLWRWCLEPGFPCKCVFLYKLITFLKLCKYSFYDLTFPNNYTFSVHILAFLGVISYIMHILKIFRFNSIYLDFYIAYYVIFLALVLILT